MSMMDKNEGSNMSKRMENCGLTKIWGETKTGIYERDLRISESGLLN